MSLETSFMISEKDRTDFINNDIAINLPEDIREKAKSRSTKIVNNYAGQDLNALSVLAYAVECGRFDEFAEKLENHYQENLKYVHPDARRIAKVPGAVRAENFFLDCYKSLGIKSRE